MVDLQGPKIRIGKFENGQIELVAGAEFILDLDCKLGNQNRVGLDYRQLIDDVSDKDILLLNDGHIVLQVESLDNKEIFCKVIQGGILSDKKGINERGGLSAPALTTRILKTLVSQLIGADYILFRFQSPK